MIRLIFFSMFSGDMDRDTASGHEIADDLHPFWLAGGDEVIQNGIDSDFVECVVVSVGEEIKFESFAFDTLFFSNVIDGDVSEIRLSGDGTETCKFRAVESDDVISFRESVPESFDFCLFRRIGIVLMVLFQERETGIIGICHDFFVFFHKKTLKFSLFF